MEKCKKWYSQVEIVDVETGEIITKSQYDRLNYRTIKKSKYYEFKEEIIRNGKSERYGIIKHIWESKPNEQTRLFD